MALELLMARCTVTVCHSRHARPARASCARRTSSSPAIGKPRFVQGDWIKPGAIVIDVGINRIDGRQARAATSTSRPRSSVAGWITPVPGGVGPMTIATLLANTLHRREAAGRGPANAGLALRRCQAFGRVNVWMP